MFQRENPQSRSLVFCTQLLVFSRQARDEFTTCRNRSVRAHRFIRFVHFRQRDIFCCKVSCDVLVFVIHQGGCAKTEEEEAASSEEDSSSFRGSGVCKWFNVRMGFGFLSMTHREGICLDSPVDVFVHQVRESKCMLSFLTERSRVRPSSVPVLLSRLRRHKHGLLC